MSMNISRRRLLAGAGAIAGAGILATLPGCGQSGGGSKDATVIRIGALKLIHSITPYFYERFVPAGYKVEVVPFETPAECKSAVTSGAIDFGNFGIAAGELGAAASEPIVLIASTCNKGMGIISKKGGPIHSIKDMKGKRVAIFPGTTQEVFFLERLRMEGMSIQDVTPVRISFSEMNMALASGDVDAYVGAEPGPGVSLSTGVGQLVEYPYSTAMGSLNLVFGTHRATITNKPDLVRAIVAMHQKATDYANAHKDEVIAMAVAKLGQKKAAIEASLPNVELTWRFGPQQVNQAKIYAEHMLALKQIRRLPDFNTFIDTRFVDAVRPA